MTKPTPRDNVVEGISRHIALYMSALRQLSAILDRENAMLLFEAGEQEVLRNAAVQDAKLALYNRVDTLARIILRSWRCGTPEDREFIREVRDPVENFRRSARLNSALLEVCLERRQRRLSRIMEKIAANEVLQCR